MSLRRRPTPILLLLLLALSASGCKLDERYGFGLPFFRFESPIVGSKLHSEDVAFALRVPAFGSALGVSLDGAALPEGGFAGAGSIVSGSLDDLAPGWHRLAASVRVRLLFLFSFELRAFTWFHTQPLNEPDFLVRESVEQLHVTHANPGAALEVVDEDGRVVAEGQADELGSLVFRELEPGPGYAVRTADWSQEGIAGLEVMSVEGSLPPQEFYSDQEIGEGFGYIETRDGTKLSIYVYLPGPPEDGPYPTLVNYSGYSPSQPGAPLSLPGVNVEILCAQFPVLCDAPNHPSGIIAGLMGFASVGVNMRGTGCSGGAWDFFETLQLLDGYDAIETVAAQPWVKHNEVGMAGLSYPGISQLFVASSQPPSLAAVTPLSVISGVQSILAPGGIINDGFAVSWAKAVFNGADPYGRGWEQGLVDEGDEVCEENQLLHGQKVDVVGKAFDNPYYVPEIYDPVSPEDFVDRIQVPVFTAGGWQDEQTGGHFSAMWDDFDNAPVTRFSGYNGSHAAGYFPQILVEWKNFLDLYVNRVVPRTDPALADLVPLFFQVLLGAPAPWPEERFADFASYEEALAAYEAEPDVRIIMESGASPEQLPGIPVGSFELFFEEWPPPAIQPRRLYFHADGGLRESLPSEAEASSAFRHDADKALLTFEVHGDYTALFPDVTWLPWQEGTAAVFVSEPLSEDMVVVGPASVDLFVQSSASDADLEATISEVRPDGQERYVQSGWLRASRRTLHPDATELRPLLTHLESDAAPLPAGQWESARLEMFPFAHVFRAGSRVRISVETPGGNRPIWNFIVTEFEDDEVIHRVSHSAAYPSSVLLPVIPGVVAPAALPPCPSLRSQPCRDYVPYENDVR